MASPPSRQKEEVLGVYKWKTGVRAKVSAQVAGEVCSKLADRGRLTPHDLVDESRPEDAPLHGEFEWDDAKAAEAYRETQARYIIRSIDVVVEELDEPIRAFVPACDDESPRAYSQIEVVMKSDSGRERTLRMAYEELSRFRNKYKTMVEFAKLFEEIDRLLFVV